MNQQDLGPLEAWQIREFPRELRQQTVNATKERCMSPGEFLTAVLVRARDAGWDRFTAPQGPTNGLAIADLAMLAEAAQRVADSAERLPKGLRASLFRALKEATRAAVPPRAPAQKALAGPDQTTTD